MMNKAEFLAQLGRLLYDISDQERVEALDYYKNYFDDAGIENESQVIQELGSPGKVASTIKADLQGNPDYGEYTEYGYQDERFKVNSQVPDRSEAAEHRQTDNERNGYGSERSQSERRERSYQDRQPHREHGYDGRQRTTGTWVLIIALIICTSPIWLGLGGGLIGLIFGILAAIFGIVVAFAAGGGGLVIGGVVLAVTGFVKMFTSPGLGLLAFGGGMVMFVIGILLILGFIWIGFKLLPKLFRGIIDLAQRLIHRRKGGNQV